MQIPTLDQLKRALHLGETIDTLQKELASILGQASHSALTMADRGIKSAAAKVRKMSAAGRRAIARAQKQRWAKAKSKGASSKAKPAGKPKRKKSKMSAAGRAAIVAAQKKRWAKVKAAKKT